MPHSTVYAIRCGFALALLCVAAVPATAQSSRAGDVAPADEYEAVLTDILEETVTDDGLVRYDLLRGDLNDDFRRVLKAVETFDATTLTTPQERLAFWINAYNVQMLQHIVETPDVQNIIDDGYEKVFFNTPVRTAGLHVTLDEIENVILRGQADRSDLAPYRLDALDPRIHVGLNCAAVSCPRLRQRALTAENVDAELDAAMRDFTASPRHFRVEDGTVILSSLLDWYGADFDQPGAPAGDFLLRYMPDTRPNYDRLRQVLAGRSAADLKAQPEVRFAYRWTVNRVVH